MTRPTIIQGEYYHVYNRGVEKRRIFWDERDRVRFIHDLYEFNDRAMTTNMRYHYAGRSSVFVPKSSQERELLVDIVAYALMPNHYHLLLRSRTDDGVSLFMQKLGIGYTLYVNERHDRSGVLFQGKYKAKHVDEEAYLRHLLFYIHLNPYEIFVQGQGTVRGTGKTKGAWSRFEGYRWSSYQDYAGIKNFPSLLNMELIQELALPMGDKHRQMLRRWVSEGAHVENSAQKFLINE